MLHARRTLEERKADPRRGQRKYGIDRTPASAAELEVAEKELTATQTQEISASTDGMFQNL